MSTKIYNAYKVCDNRIETVFKIKRELEPLYEKLVFSQLDQLGYRTLKGIQGYMPKGYIFWDVIKRGVLYGGIRKYKEESEKKLNTPLKEMYPDDLQYVLQGYVDQEKNDPLNFSASMVLIEYKGQMYVQFFGFHGYEYLTECFGKYFKGLVKNGVLADWRYQNQTDDEDGDDWEERENMWDEIYKSNGWDGYYSPAQVGFSHDFFSRIFFILHKYSEQKRKNKETRIPNKKESSKEG